MAGILRIHEPSVVLEAPRVGRARREHQHGDEAVTRAALHELALDNLRGLRWPRWRHDRPRVEAGSRGLFHLTRDLLSEGLEDSATLRGLRIGRVAGDLIGNVGAAAGQVLQKDVSERAQGAVAKVVGPAAP